MPNIAVGLKGKGVWCYLELCLLLQGLYDGMGWGKDPFILLFICRAVVLLLPQSIADHGGSVTEGLSHAITSATTACIEIGR